MTSNKTHKNLVTGEEIKDCFPNLDLNPIELEDISQTISQLLVDAGKKLDQEARKHKHLKNLQGIYKHLSKASEYMQDLPTNKTKDIGLTFDDWIKVQGIINRLKQNEKISTYKAHKQKIYSELFYYLHSVLTGIEAGAKLGWSSRSELTKFEKAVHFLLEKIGVTVVEDKYQKKNKEDITAEAIKNYIKLAQKFYNRRKKK